MSTPLAGKFQDHYEVLGVDAKSDTETIQRAYARLMDKYRPENADSGDPEKLEAVNLAFEVLSDALARREFDKVVGVGEGQSALTFNPREFFDVMGQQAGLRGALLCLLYDRRRTKPYTPSISMRILENALKANLEELTFVLWYLKQRGLVQNDDKSNLQITVEGLDFLETNPPSAESILPFMKPTTVTGPPAPKTQPATRNPAMLPAGAAERESLMKVISRNLTLRVNQPQK